MLSNTSPPPFFRFQLGDTEGMVVSDGEVLSGKPSVTHPRPEDEVDAFLTKSFLPLDRLVFAANVLLVRHNGRLIMFDAGLGTMREKPTWGANAGQLMRNLEAAQVDPADVDTIILTHGHGEHIAGLTAEDGNLQFPNAEICINQTEYEHWIDPEQTGPKWVFDHGQAVRNLEANADRLRFISNGEEFLPGIEAIATPGHTVAHMSFILRSLGKQLFILGDMARHYIVNIEKPEWQFVGDADRELTVQTRLQVLGRVATQRIPVLAYHFPWPGIGHIGATDDGFRYYPIEPDLLRACVL